MVNEGCLYKCPFRKFHFNYTAHKSKEVSSESGIFFDNCVQVSARDPSQVLKSGWVRPEDLQDYSEVTNYFKIVGRSLKRSKVIRCVVAYMQESWDGGLLDIVCDSLHVFNRAYGAYLDNKSLGESGFFKKVTSCDKDCTRCELLREPGQEAPAGSGNSRRNNRWTRVSASTNGVMNDLSDEQSTEAAGMAHERGRWRGEGAAQDAGADSDGRQ